MDVFLFVTDELPRPGRAGHLSYNHAVISWAQAKGHQVIILMIGARLGWLVEHYDIAPVCGPVLGAAGGRVFIKSPKGALRILLRGALGRLPPAWTALLKRRRLGADAVLGRFMNEAEVAWAGEAVKRLKPDGLIIDTIFRSPVLEHPACQNVNSLILTHDLFFHRHAALKRAGYIVQPAAMSRDDEAAWLTKARHIVAIQPDEAATLAAMCPGRNIILAPMPAALCPPPPQTKRIPGRLVFTGSATLPNLDGLRWFLGDVWPLLGADITLDLIGDCGAALGPLPPGVARLGRVENLAPLLHRAALAIAPLRAGSGLKIKILDYARHGLATIGTSAALAGFATDDAAPFMTADDPTRFSVAINEQINSPINPSQPLAYIAAHYGAGKCFEDLTKFGLS